MHIDINDYADNKIWVRYYFLKYLPKFLYSWAASYFYKMKTNRTISLKHPITFADKINYLKLYNATRQKMLLTDKLIAKDIITKKFPELNVAKTFQVASSFEELDFSKCPNTFIIKTNHACKTNIIIYDKDAISKEELLKYRKYYKKVLKVNYAYWGTLELQYKNIKPLIYTEELLVSKNPLYDMHEYQVYCINGEVELIQLNRFFDGDKQMTLTFDKNFEEPKFFPILKPLYYKINYDFNFPNKDKIIKYAKLLSSEFTFVRVDFFEFDNILYF